MIKSWVESANKPSCEFPVNNLPYGVFSRTDGLLRCGVAIGDFVFDCSAAEEQGLLEVSKAPILSKSVWNPLMESGSATWSELRERLMDFFVEGSTKQSLVQSLLYPLSEVNLHMPFNVAEFTDFYSGKHHASNVGTMFRGQENALPPNWLHMPIGYNGRASSVFVSGTNVHRPWGQLKSTKHENPAFLPSRRFDFELEMGAIVGKNSNAPVSTEEADAMIFGYVMLNDWSARDIQAWEYQPLGPFQAKAAATTISPWIVTSLALDPFRISAPDRDVELLPYLKETNPSFYNINLEVFLSPAGTEEHLISRTNYNEIYYSAAQQLAHHTSSGCPMRVGDLLGSGTISGSDRNSRGSMLELSWGGKEPLNLGNETRTFLQDGDTVIFRGGAKTSDYKVGFGECIGKVMPALENPIST